jgi:uncharacterized protein (TIGR02246 family)
MGQRLSLIALALTACSTALLAAEASPPTDRWNAAWVAGDPAELSTLYTEDARVMTPNSPSRIGRTDIDAMFTRMMGREMAIASTVVEDLEGDDIWVRRTDYVMTYAGQHTDDGEAVEVWRKVDGRWLLHLEIFTSRNIRPIAYDDPAPEYDRIRFKPAPTEMEGPAGSTAEPGNDQRAEPEVATEEDVTEEAATEETSPPASSSPNP